MLRRSLALLGLAACHRGDSTVRADPTPPVAAVDAVSTPLPLPPPVHTVSGPIKGSFEVRAQRVVVAEPIVISFVVVPTIALEIFLGGDQRNQANFPMRVAVKVMDAAGSIVCDSVDKPALPSFGGLGSASTYAPGKEFRESFVLNPICPALATPGRYRVTLHRRLAPMSLTVTKAGSTVPLSCDIHPLHEGPLPTSYGPDCVKAVASLPWVTTQFDLDVRPFDAATLAKAVDTRLDEAARATDTMAKHRIETWLCGWVACGCAKMGATFKPADLPAAEPSTLAKGCPR